jgi:small subunit ribosomal protein S2
MSPVVTMSQLLEAGVHFGHQTRRWNPKMQRFIYGERNGIHLHDLNQTLESLTKAYICVRDIVASGALVLFVGTKKQTRDSVEQFAERCGQPYVNQRWLGGMLTNFETMAKRVAKMKEYQRMREAGEFEKMPKKEALMLSRELAKLERNLSGIRTMRSRPQIVFVLDTKKEHIAVTEANKLGIPVIAVVDTNCDPEVIDYVIPGNDDAIRSSELMCRVICEAVEEGQLIASKRLEGSPVSSEESVERTPEDKQAIAKEQEQAKKAAAEAFREKEKKIAEEIAATPLGDSSPGEDQESSKE